MFEEIFSHILFECYKYKLVDPREIFVDSTHVKARANNKKYQKRKAQEEALFYEELLKKEINQDRKEHGKKEFKDKNDDYNRPSSTGGSKKKQLSVVHQPLIVVGFTKENISRCLRMQ